MAIKTKFVCGASGSESATAGDAVLTYEAWDTNPTNYDGVPGNFATLIGALRTAVLAAAPTTWDGLDRESYSWREDDGRNRRFLFDIKYTWAPPESTRRWSWDTSGGTVRITTSRSTTNRYPIPGRVAPNFQGSIEVKNNEPQGTDIVIPALKLTCTYKHPASSSIVNATTIDAYIKTLASLSGTVNNGSWLTYAAGELLFLGCSGEYVPNKPTEIQYNFAASENVTGLSIGSIVGIAKKGHEYLWVLFEGDEDATAKKRIQTPLAAYVEKVYQETNFNSLGIH